MSTTRTERVGASGTSTGGRGAVGVAFVVIVALALLLIVRARPTAEPFDPRSGAPDGATALVALLERSGASVDITRSAPPPGTDTRLLVLSDRLDDEQRNATLDFIEAGGVAVVADPASTVHGGPDLAGGSDALVAVPLPAERLPVAAETTIEPGACNMTELAGLRGLYVPDGLLFPVGPDEPQCFDGNARSFVVVRSIGLGSVVGLGDNEVFVNEHLRRADNAGLAVSLLAPAGDGANRGDVTVLLGTGAAPSLQDIGTGDDTLTDLVPTWAWMSIVLAAIAFVVFAIARGARVGGVVEEPLTSRIGGSELVAATGTLMQRARHTARAGSLLQGRMRRDIARELHVDAVAPVSELDRLAAARWGTSPGEVASLLTDPVGDDRQLMDLSVRLSRFRQDVLHDR